jgi:hypothetical protein
VKLAAAVVLLLAACDTGIAPYDPSKIIDAAPVTRCTEAVMHSDYEWLRDNVFQVSCGAFTSCHQGGGSAAAQLDLTAAHAYQNLVNVASSTFPGQWVRVVPGDPDHSYLMVKLGGVPGPLGDGGLMPQNGQMLCQPKIEAVRRWIAAGAQGPAAGPIDAGIIDGMVLNEIDASVIEEDASVVEPDAGM